MPNLTLAIPAELKEKMDAHKEINWSEVARQAIHEKTLLLEKMNSIFGGSRISEADINAYTKSIKKQSLKRNKAK